MTLCSVPTPTLCCKADSVARFTMYESGPVREMPGHGGRVKSITDLCKYREY